jgi:hypothetical protein
MRVAYFPNQCAQNSAPVMTAIINSLRRAGHTCVENSMDADAAVIWSVLWSGRMVANRAIWSRYRQSGRPVIVVDIGALYRGETWKIALNTLTADGYYGHVDQLDPDRPRRLGISLALNLSTNPRIVVAAQHTRSLQVAGIDSLETWIIDQIHKLQQVTDRPIVIRPHPRSRLSRDCMQQLPKNVVIEHPQKLINTYDSYNLTFDCHAIVNYNSSPGIQAALAGTRPVVDRTSLAHSVGIDIANIEEPYITDRDQWLIEICHTEYQLKEIEQGQWITRLQL